MRRFRRIFAPAFVGLVLVTACAPSTPEACTAEGAGKGNAPVLAFRELPAPNPGTGTCRNLAKLVRNEADLRAEYAALKLPDAVPQVDFTKDAVVFLSNDNGAGAAWHVEDGDEIAIGTARCSENGASCNDFVFAVTTRATKVKLYPCELVSCGRPIQ